MQAYQASLREVHRAALRMLHHVDPERVPADCHLPSGAAPAGAGSAPQAQRAVQLAAVMRPQRGPQSGSPPAGAHASALWRPPSHSQEAPQRHNDSHALPAAGAQQLHSLPAPSQAQGAPAAGALGPRELPGGVTPQQFQAWLQTQDGARHHSALTLQEGARAVALSARARQISGSGEPSGQAAAQPGPAPSQPATNGAEGMATNAPMAWLLAQQRSYEDRQRQGGGVRGAPLLASAVWARQHLQPPEAQAVHAAGAGTQDEPIEIEESD